jgi:hypothetical protein
MTKRISTVEADLITKFGTPAHESYDIEELREYGVDFNQLIKEYVRDGNKKIVLTLTTEEVE